MKAVSCASCTTNGLAPMVKAINDEFGIAMGLNVRVGMEDNVLMRRGEPVQNNAQLVERTVRIANELDRRPATPDEARERFALRGRAEGELPTPTVHAEA